MIFQRAGQIRVAVFAMDGVEREDITVPVRALVDAGAAVDIISLKHGEIRTFEHHTPSVTLSVDKIFDDVSPQDYDALLLPGGALNAGALRVLPAAQAFAAAFDRDDKPIAAICHGPWLLPSADFLAGRTLTSYHTIHDDIENAGGTWVDAPVVADGNLLTSRLPSDITEFNERMLALVNGSEPAFVSR